MESISPGLRGTSYLGFTAPEAHYPERVVSKRAARPGGRVKMQPARERWPQSGAPGHPRRVSVRQQRFAHSSRLLSSDSWGEFGAVKPPLEVCRAKVAEVERVGAERVGRQRRPIHEIGGSFHDDDLIGTAGDFETKLAGDNTNIVERHGHRAWLLHFQRADVGAVAA